MAQECCPYPLTFKAELSEPLSRGLWLLKLLLGIPHFIILIALWVGWVFATIIAFFAILFEGRYPRGLFDFNVGVLRWTWRVEFYSYAALATDKYPPFTLKSMPDYPADLDVPYPEVLSRGLALVKWWLLAIPHYIIVGFFTGGLFSWKFDSWRGGPPGLIIILTLFAGICLLFTGKYPTELYKLIIGMDRWAYRVTVYAGLMTDQYPPFRLD